MINEQHNVLSDRDLFAIPQHSNTLNLYLGPLCGECRVTVPAARIPSGTLRQGGCGEDFGLTEAGEWCVQETLSWLKLESGVKKKAGDSIVR